MINGTHAGNHWKIFTDFLYGRLRHNTETGVLYPSMQIRSIPFTRALTYINRDYIVYGLYDFGLLIFID